MKFPLLCFSLMLIFISCKNQEEERQSKETPTTDTEERDQRSTDDLSPETGTNEASSRSSPDTSNDETEETPEEPLSGLAYGNYKKTDEEDAACSCYCIEISASGESELCLKDQEIYITARLSQNNGLTQVYFSSPSSKNNNDDLPWEDFDTNHPIAEITPTEDGMELDWKGFHIEGELAVDYAIYGKKTLEGSYKKQ